jgi:hypothetical protein
VHWFMFNLPDGLENELSAHAARTGEARERVIVRALRTLLETEAPAPPREYEPPSSSPPLPPHQRPPRVAARASKTPRRPETTGALAPRVRVR